MKYLVDVTGEGYVQLDDQDYEGPEDNIADDEGIYHIEAESEEEAMQIALDLDAVLNGGTYPEPSEAEMI